MKHLLLSILSLCLAVVIAWMVWHDYTAVAAFQARANEGSLSVIEETSNTLKRGGGRTRTYDASIDGIRVPIVTRETLARGQPYPVLFLADALRNHAPATGPFHAFKFGRKSDARWSVFVRAYGKMDLLELAGIEALCLVGACVFWRTYRRTGRT